MPIEVIPGPKAVDTLKSNDVASWPSRGAEFNRVEPLAKPAFYPSFTIARGDSIFTIGSCFARNVENALIQRGFDLPSREILKSDPEFAAIGPNVLNNYGVPSIFNEISWGLGTRKFVPEENFFEITDGKYVDIHLNQAIRPASLETVTKRRAAIRAAYSQIKSCRMVIITLGLTECWYDTKSGLYLNTAPRRSLVRSLPERFELHVLNHAETYDFLKKSFNDLKKHGRPDLRVVLTVSPVPLTATYRERDVIVANMYSKSVLRTAAEEIVSEFDFVDYFPSFESILHSDRLTVWEDDLVHIKKPIIELNVSRMVEKYTGATEASDNPDELLTRLKSTAETKPGHVFGELEGRWDILEASPELALMFADAAIKLRKNDVARQALELVPEEFEQSKQTWIGAQILYAEKKFEDVVALLSGSKEQFRRRGQFWTMLITSLFEAGYSEEGSAAVQEWAKIVPNSAEPYRIGANYLAKLNDQRGAEYMFRKARLLIPDDDSARVDLDYADFLTSLGRIMPAREVVRKVVPGNPSQAARLEELKLRLNLN
jgi:hypothetical protein